MRRHRGDALERPSAPEASEAEDMSWIVGRRPVAEALASGARLDRIWIADERATLGWWRPFETAARASGAVLTRVPREALDRMARGAVHQGVIARSAAATLSAAEDVVAAAPSPALLLLVDGVQDPRNLGAIIRSAAAAGCHGVLLPERRAAGLTPAAAKAAAGTLTRIPLARAKNVQRALELLRDAGVWTVGLVAGERAIWETDLSVPTCLVIGGEEGGLSRLARERCDNLAGIPLAAGVDSLNAAAAASVGLFEAVRQRSARIAGARQPPSGSRV